MERGGEGQVEGLVEQMEEKEPQGLYGNNVWYTIKNWVPYFKK